MSKKLFNHKLSNGKSITVSYAEILGLCEDTDISVSPKLKGRLQLEVFIHELLHAEFDEMSEEEVDQKARSIAIYLWKVGYRKTKVKKRKPK